MRVLTKNSVEESEKNAVQSGAFSFRELMENAGNRAAEIIMREYAVENKKIALLCGSGNNGGDGFVTARRLFEYGADVTVITPCGKPATENALFYYEKLDGIRITDTFEGEFDIIIDALFGIGLNREMSAELISLIERVNQADAVRIAIDLPSGVHADSGRVLGAAFDAELTVTFIALKPCFVLPPASDYCGRVITADIGVTPVEKDYYVTEAPEFPKRRHNSHKGSYGTALLVCGSYGMAGAAILACRAALRSGVGIAKCVLCDGIYPAFTAAVPEAVCLPVKQSENGTFADGILADEYLKGADAVLFGCGVGKGENIKALLEKLIISADLPLVLDADGINALASGIELLKKSNAPIIITPHPGEMARLVGKTTAEVESDRINTARSFAQEYNCIVVLKGADTIVASPDGEISFNLPGNPGMAKGGSGDVLAGICVSLLAQGLEPLKAAKAAVYLHSTAGDKAARKRGERAMLPSDIIEEL